MNFMPVEKFKLLKKRWEECDTPEILQDPENFDQYILSSLEDINSVPGLATIWSCQGHPTSENKIAEGYIMFAVKDQNGLNKLQLFYNNLSLMFNKQRNLVRLTMTERQDITAPHEDGKLTHWYPVWILSWRVNVNNWQRETAKVNRAAQLAVAGTMYTLITGTTPYAQN